MEWLPLALLVGGSLVLLFFLCSLIYLLCSHKDKRPLQTSPRLSIDEELHLGDVTYHSWARSSLYDTTKSLAGDSMRDSTYSSMSEGTDTSSITSVPASDPAGPGCSIRCGPACTPGPGAPGVPGPPSVSLRLHFLGQGQNGVAGNVPAAGRVALTVQEARGLPARDYGPSPDPAVQLTVSRARWMLRTRGGAPLHHLRTRTLRRARQPLFNEDFAIEARAGDVKDWVLDVRVLDDCRLRGGSTTLCAGEVRLRGHAKQIVSGEPLQLCVPLQIRPQERGLLLFGLSFLPTAQRLNISIIKATKLELDHVVANAKDFRPYVRATLVQSSSGRRVQTVRTEPQERDPAREAASDPEFCETLILNVTLAQLATQALVVAVCHRLPESDEREPGQRRPRDRVVGAVAIGNQVSSERGRDHWRALQQRARRVVSVWHTLT